MSFSLLQVLPFAAAFGLALLLTPMVRAFARQIGMVAKPNSERWHKQPTAMLGGVAVFFAVTLTAVFFVPQTAYSPYILAASAFLFVIGLLDDLFNAKPYQKLIGQVMGAALVIYYGLTLPWTNSAVVNAGLTVFWLIGITNAVNLLDNMDGLAAGISAIAAATLAVNFIANGQINEALLVGTFAAALIGFLVYNSNPATIFMGDCGSLFIGFFLASSALMSPTGGRSRSFLPVLLVPILILLIPIFDTTFVTLLRKLSGRSASQGGRDHTSHRLVALGMSERRAVWMLYGFAALSGALAIMARQVAVRYSIPVIAVFALLLVLLGVHLAGVKVYDEEEVKAARNKPVFAFLLDLSYKRRVFEVLLDITLIILAYYSSYLLLLEMNPEAWQQLLMTLPILLFIKTATFLVMGVYRGLWRYTSVSDLLVIAKAVIVGSALSVLAVLFKFRFAGFSRAVFIMDGLLLFITLAGSRLAFRLFRKVLPTTRRREGARTLIYGAGDAGELLLRELQNNRELNFAPVGFVDDDPTKKDKVMHGLRVYGGNGNLRKLCQTLQVEEVIISSGQFTPERLSAIVRDCAEENIGLRRMKIDIEPLSDEIVNG